MYLLLRNCTIHSFLELRNYIRKASTVLYTYHHTGYEDNKKCNITFCRPHSSPIDVRQDSSPIQSILLKVLYTGFEQKVDF